MANESKTVGAEVIDDIVTSNPIEPDSLYMKQQRDVSQMRNVLLSCDSKNIHSVKTTIQNILVMQLTRNMSRIVKYSEVMDRLEDKLYASVDYTISSVDETDPDTLGKLLQMQKFLVTNMNESQKLLEPYLNGKYNLDPIFTEVVDDAVNTESLGSELIDKDARERIRNSAQAVLNIIQNPLDNTEQDEPKEEYHQMSIDDLLVNEEISEQKSAETSTEPAEPTETPTEVVQVDNKGFIGGRLSPDELDKALGISESKEEQSPKEDTDVNTKRSMTSSQRRTSKAAQEALKLLGGD
jgi:hypothetical protein